MKLATDVVAKSLGKPASYVSVQLNTNQKLSFAGTKEPAAMCELTSIGSLSVELNKQHSKAIMEFLQKTLGVPPTRIYINFHNANKGDVGFNNTTFDSLI